MPPDPHHPHHAELADRIRIQHMLDAARSAVRFMDGRGLHDLEADELLARGVTHCLQEIGEAASRTSEAGRERIEGVPWTKIVGTRHRLVHVYWGVDLGLIYEVVVRDLPALIAALEAGTTGWPLPEDEG